MSALALHRAADRAAHARPNTIAAYGDTFRLLLGFAAQQLGRQPCELDGADSTRR
jgi:hypothetical protein